MKVLFIFNYQREVPPFMQTAVTFAKDYFDKVIFITRHLTNDNSITICHPNVDVIQVSEHIRRLMFFTSPLRGIMNRFIISDFLKYRDLALMKAQLTTQFMSDCLYFTAKKRIKEYIEQGYDVYTLATWFSSEAVTIARFKQKYKIRKTVSFAHSFEIDPDKNRYVNRSFNDFKHQNIDEVHYISHKMKDIYYTTAKDLKIRERYDDKARLTYLGSIKYYQDYCNPSADGIFRIVSCSGVTPVKRLHLIVDALNKWSKDAMIQWTHIGGGPLFNDIETKAKDLIESNSNISVKLLGWKNNKEVQQYYAENPVDLFINVSEAEGLPVSIMEAMSYGIPCIATNVGGTSEIVNENTGFLLAKNCSGADILKEIEQYYELSLADRNAYRKKAIETWVLGFDAKKTMNEFFENLAE